MPINEKQKVQLAEKVEEVIQSTNFGEVLRVYDAYTYEEMVHDAFESVDMPSDIEPQDVKHELTITNKTNPEAWAELLASKDILDGAELKKVLDNEDELAQYMVLDHFDGNFEATVEIKEELHEIRERKPDVKTLSDELENVYDETEFIEYLKQERKDEFDEKVRELAADEGVPVDTPVEKIPYTAYINLTKDFDTLAERYLEQAIEKESVSTFAVEYINNILVEEKAYELDIEVDAEQLEEA